MTARADSFLMELLLIVQGLMRDERQGPRRFVVAPLLPPSLGFSGTACGRGVLAGSRFRLPVCSSFLRVPGGAGVMSSRGLFVPVDAAAASASHVFCDCFVVGLVIVGKLCLGVGRAVVRNKESACSVLLFSSGWCALCPCRNSY